MPLVLLTWDKTKLSGNRVLDLARALPAVVAGALTIEPPELGQLRAEEIEVRLRMVDIYDINASPLSIEIFANAYPARQANIQERTNLIASAVNRFIDEHHPNMRDRLGKKQSFVWVLLAPAGFAHL